MFKEASGFDSETEVIEHKSIDENGRPHTRKVAGGIKWSNITLKRGVDESLDIWKWRDDRINKGADAARVDGKIELLDIAGGTIATYQFKQGWPIKYVAATLDASTNNVALEELHICHEGSRGSSADDRTGGGKGMRTEFPFTLPRGYVDAAGTVHREGAMRLATARDEIEPLRAAEVKQNEAYLSVLLLSRVVTKLGDGPRGDAGRRRGPLRGRLRPSAAALRAAEHGRRVGRSGDVPVVRARRSRLTSPRSRTGAWGNDAAVSA